SAGRNRLRGSFHAGRDERLIDFVAGISGEHLAIAGSGNAMLRTAAKAGRVDLIADVGVGVDGGWLRPGAGLDLRRLVAAGLGAFVGLRVGSRVRALALVVR